MSYRHKRRIKTTGFIIAGLIGAAILGGGAAAVSELWPRQTGTDAAKVAVRYVEALEGCSVTDGDTIRCGDERIRLLGIDAPEMPGHCRAGRDCVEGDPYASRSSLAAAMMGQLTIERVGEDRYGRTLAVVAGAHGDLSCWQLKQRQVVYKAKWDDGLRVARTCPGQLL